MTSSAGIPRGVFWTVVVVLLALLVWSFVALGQKPKEVVVEVEVQRPLGDNQLLVTLNAPNDVKVLRISTYLAKADSPSGMGRYYEVIWKNETTSEQTYKLFIEPEGQSPFAVSSGLSKIKAGAEAKGTLWFAQTDMPKEVTIEIVKVQK